LLWLQVVGIQARYGVAVAAGGGYTSQVRRCCGYRWWVYKPGTALLWLQVVGQDEQQPRKEPRPRVSEPDRRQTAADVDDAQLMSSDVDEELDMEDYPPLDLDDITLTDTSPGGGGGTAAGAADVADIAWN